MKDFGIITKSTCEGAAMKENDLLYVLYSFKGHVYRIEGGRITKADNFDREIVSRHALRMSAH